MKASTFLWMTGLCIAFGVTSRAFAQTPSSDGGSDWGNAVNNIMIQNYTTDRQFDRLRETSGTKESNSPRPSNLSRRSNSAADSSIAPRLLAAKFPAAERSNAERFYGALLKLYPVSAKQFGLPTNNNFENISAVFVCSNMQMVSQQRVSAENCAAVSKQMQRATAKGSSSVKVRQVKFEEMAITSSMMNVAFAGMQKKPDPSLQVRLAAQASRNVGMITKIPGDRMQITSKGLVMK
jgi:hypothetical protein